MIKKLMIILGLATAWVFGEKATIDITKENTKWLTNDGNAVLNIYTKMPNGLSLDAEVYLRNYYVISYIRINYDFSATVDTKESLKMSNVYQMFKEHAELVKNSSAGLTPFNAELMASSDKLIKQYGFLPVLQISEKSMIVTPNEDALYNYEQGMFKKVIVYNKPLNFEYKLRFSKDLLKELDAFAKEQEQKAYWGD